MINHYNMCVITLLQCMHAVPIPSAVPACSHLTLYNASDVLFQDKKPSHNRASKSKLLLYQVQYQKGT